MLEPDPSFRPTRTRDGYLPLEDLGLIGDGSTVALVGHDGNICWLCLPRFDSEPLLCGLLDRNRGGHFSITPDGPTEARRRYEPDTGVLVTDLRSATGVVRLTDALALGNGAADQLQHDVYGEVLDCADQRVRSGGQLKLPLWASLASLADTAGEAGRQRGHHRD